VEVGTNKSLNSGIKNSIDHWMNERKNDQKKKKLLMDRLFLSFFLFCRCFLPFSRKWFGIQWWWYTICVWKWTFSKRKFKFSSFK
jgi:hypothetical protein